MAYFGHGFISSREMTTETLFFDVSPGGLSHILFITIQQEIGFRSSNTLNESQFPDDLI